MKTARRPGTSRGRTVRVAGAVAVWGLLVVVADERAASSTETADDVASAVRIDRVLATSAELTAALRRTRIELAGGAESGGPDELGVAFDATQRAVAEAAEAGVSGTALAGFDRVAVEAERLSELGPEAGGRAGAWRSEDLALASAAVLDAVSTLAGHPVSGSSHAQSLDRLLRAVEADVAVAASGLELLAQPPEERRSAAGALADARRRAQVLMAATLPALPVDVRDRLGDAGEQGAGEQLFRQLAALGDPVVAAEATSGPSELLAAASAHDGRLDAVVDEVVGDLRSAGARRLERAEQAASAARRLLWVVIGIGPALVLLLAAGALRRRRRDRHAAAEHPSDTEAEGAAGDVAPSPTSTSGFVALVDRHQVLVDHQLRVLERLGSAPGMGPDDVGHTGAWRGAIDEVERLAVLGRRLDENALVLTGAPRAERSIPATDVADLVEAAVVEAAAEAPVAVDAPEGVAVSGEAALDVAHMVAELVANAAACTAESSHARAVPGRPAAWVRARVGRDGVLRIVVRDQGPLLDEASLARLGEAVADASAVAAHRALADGRLGLATVARLAARRGCAVRFGQTADGWTEARLEVPARLVATEPAAASPGEDRTQEVPVQTSEPPSTDGVWGWSADGDYRPAAGWTRAGEYVPGDPAAPDHLAGRLPEGEAFEAGLASLLSGEPAEPRS